MPRRVLSSDPYAGTALDSGSSSQPPKRRRILSSDPTAGKPQSQLSQGKPQAWYEGAWESARQAIFGSPDREEAKAAGVGLQPTPAEMAEAAYVGSAFMGGPGLLSGLPRVARASAPVRAALANPGKAAAVYGAIPGLLNESLGQAAAGAVTGAGFAKLGGVVPGAAGKVREFVSEHRPAVMGTLGALPGVVQGDPIEAVEGAVAGAALGKFGGRRAPKGAPEAARVVVPNDAAAARRLAQQLASEGRNEEARAVVDAFRARASSAPAPKAEAPKPKLKRPEFVEGAVLAPEDPNAYSKGFPAGQRPDLGPREPLTPATPPKPKAAPVDKGREAAERHRQIVAVAKEAARSNPKMGAKIWIELDDAGNPVRVLTSDQAGAAKRAGRPTTFMKNLWGNASFLTAE